MKACALIGLHMMAVENVFRDMWRCGCPKKALCGAATGLNGQDVRIFLLWSVTTTTSEISLLKSLGRIGQVKLSLFSKKIGRSGGWHSAATCQWTFYARKRWMRVGRAQSRLGLPRSLCSECLEGRRRCSDAKVLSFNVRPGLQAGDSFEHFVPSSE